MNEVHLHQLFDSRKLGNSFITTEGYQLDVISFGQLNKSSGPDFLEAMVRLDGKIWAGHIEFHLKSSDWLKHGHQNDKTYNNVIAHFVLEHDVEILSGDYQLPVVELKSMIQDNPRLSVTGFLAARHWVACEPFLPEIEKALIKAQMIKAFDKRWRRKREETIHLFKKYNGDQKLVLLHLVARYLGGKFNAVAMQNLVKKVDFSTVNHIGFDFEKIQTYLIGLSGLLDDENFEYYRFLYQLNPMKEVEWKTYGMRPPSQPLNRIKQLALILSRSSQIEISTEIKYWIKFFDLRQVSDVPSIGKGMQNSLLINAVVPFLLAVAWFKNDQIIHNDAINILQQISPEQNTITRAWAKRGVEAQNALESQALIGLKNSFCNEKKCLFCDIGKKVLKA